MSISARRKGIFDNRPTGSKIRQLQRRPVKPAISRVHPFRVNSAELARRKFLHLAAGAAALPAMSWSADAQTYPTRPITMIVPYTAGSATDVWARVLAEWMGRSLGQPTVIENVTGADGSIGVGRVARARPDGQTIVLGSIATHVLNGAYYSLSYDVLNGFAPICPLGTIPVLLYVRKLNELIAWLKANPNKASAGVVSVGYRLVIAAFQKETGTQFTLVPYRGVPPELQDLVAGQIDFCFDSPLSLAQVRAGSVKALAVTSDTRIALAPDIPTFTEMGLPTVSFLAWAGLFAPKGTPREIINKLNAAVVEALADPTVRSRFAALGWRFFRASGRDLRRSARW